MTKKKNEAPWSSGYVQCIDIQALPNGDRESYCGRPWKDDPRGKGEGAIELVPCQACVERMVGVIKQLSTLAAECATRASNAESATMPLEVALARWPGIAVCAQMAMENEVSRKNLQIKVYQRHAEKAMKALRPATRCSMLREVSRLFDEISIIRQHTPEMWLVALSERDPHRVANPLIHAQESSEDPQGGVQEKSCIDDEIPF